MNRAEFLELLLNGESSGVEFKRDVVRNDQVARELVAFLNLNGGALLLGVEDDGSISGTTRDNLEEWVAESCRIKIDPPIVPFMDWHTEAVTGKRVLAVKVPIGPDKPYALVHNQRNTYFIRVGSTCREASREELERMFQASGHLRYGLKPVPGTSIADLDMRRLSDYFFRILRMDAPDPSDYEQWQTLLCNLELAATSIGETHATIDGLILFGGNLPRFLPQSGIRAICYLGEEPDYATRADEDLKGPLVPLGNPDGLIVEPGVVDMAWDFVRRNIIPSSYLEGANRVDRWEYPEEVVREALVNALVHRDYSIAGTDIMLAIYSNRLEILSPGRLPNTVTTDGIRAGMRYARNQTLVNVMRDYGYVDARGMGVRNKIIPGMRAHNGTEPDLVEEENRFTVCLWKESKSV